jgi:phage shock protein E
MLDALKSMLGIGTPINYAELVKSGAIIVDVRSIGEFAGGHIKSAINIPVEALSKNGQLLKNKQQVIITCCASGMRSAAAKSMLLSQGYETVYNGGGWSSLQSKLSMS